MNILQIFFETDIIMPIWQMGQLERLWNMSKFFSRQVVEIDIFDLNICACSTFDCTSYICESLEVFENIALINFNILLHFISENIISTKLL